ncbi:malonyl-CoA:anthocyanidin 5-O-glucoside-6''-O-malonyltransferase-like [Lolium rigidum]|uniref:malonyl-CoA:anthocyanidin 5-O-glucoside-6''-O-malonyltransferase-like n=1 Tax=Lolium rigidum TaxID=89674 RepID=UPI001F5D00E6|nr:malonyl-CoA:anthocyanidin 5-O-glucoside-6''-O-malonyltransferase-like [Lolium rigidum]
MALMQMLRFPIWRKKSPIQLLLASGMCGVATNIRVRVLNVTHVQPAQTTNLPRHGAMIKLSPFDTCFLALRPAQVLFFYDGTSLPPFPSLVSLLRVSLGATLGIFAPFAGKVTACSDDHDVVIDCSPDPGVKFVEAEYSGDAADMRRLARDKEHDTEAFLQLVPELEVGRLPAPAFAVQVTRPADGGGAVAVGVVMHHAVADGQSLWQFMRAWSTMSQEGSLAVALAPTFDRTGILRHPKAEAAARNLARFSAPELPKVNRFPDPDWRRQSPRTYLLTAGQIKSLKQRILFLQSQATTKNGDGPPEPPTTYVAIASLLWTSIVRARSVNSAATLDDEYLSFPADYRRRLHPPLEPGFFGNCIKVHYVRATTSDLVCRSVNNDNGLVRAAAGFGRAMREHVEKEDPLGDADRWVEMIQGLTRERLMVLGGSNRHMMYEVDFGWGQPRRVEFILNTTLLGASGGAVYVSVNLHRDHVDTFEANFLSHV